jgi:hypothetical protein
MRAPAAFSMSLMRLTWAGVILLPLPAYALELWLATVFQGFPDGENLALLRTVEAYGVERDLAVLVALVLAAAWVLPRIVHRRAIARLRRRARTEIDLHHGPTYRRPPTRVLRFPAEGGAIEMAGARFAVRSAGVLALVAIVELAVFVRMLGWRSFDCMMCRAPTTVYVPDLREHLVLIGLIVAFTAFHLPRRASIVAPLHDLLEKREAGERALGPPPCPRCDPG